MKAASQQHHNIVKLLLDAGADESLVDAEGKSYLDILRNSKRASTVIYSDNVCCFLGNMKETDEESDGVNLKNVTDKNIEENNEMENSVKGQLDSESNGVSVALVIDKCHSEGRKGVKCDRCGLVTLSLSRVGSQRCCIKCRYK